MERLRCVVERITYQNETNGYSVIKCRTKGYQDLITVVDAPLIAFFGKLIDRRFTFEPCFPKLTKMLSNKQANLFQ